MLPTTADLGLRACGPAPAPLLEDLVMGLQHLVLGEGGADAIAGAVATGATWHWTSASGRWDDLVVRMLEDVLYRAEVDGQWVTTVEVAPMMAADEHGRTASARVQWVPTDEVPLELEIKAVTRHELRVGELAAGVTLEGVPGLVPDIEGPAWVANVILDI